MKDIIIADRGFPSLGVIFELAQNGFDFVIRYTGEHFLRNDDSLRVTHRDL